MNPEQAEKAYEEGFDLLQELCPPREVSESMRKAGAHYMAVALDSFEPKTGFFTMEQFELQTNV